MQKKPFSAFAIGESGQVSKTVTESVIAAFADVSEDRNPVHLDAEYAAQSFFKQRIAHGMLGAGLISAALANHCPGPGTIYLGQELKFKAPVYIGETITATVTITEKNDDKKIMKLSTIVTKADGTVVIDGVATVKLFQ